MTPDKHTPCPACPDSVRAVFDSAYALVMRIEDRRFSEVPSEIFVAATAVHSALLALAPFVNAHKANQIHSLSPELEAARHPKLAA